MQRGWVSTLAIAANIARERAALSVMDSNSAGDLRLWLAEGEGLDWASTAEGPTTPQPMKTINATERIGISCPHHRSDKGKNWPRRNVPYARTNRGNRFALTPKIAPKPNRSAKVRSRCRVRQRRGTSAASATHR